MPSFPSALLVVLYVLALRISVTIRLLTVLKEPLDVAWLDIRFQPKVRIFSTLGQPDWNGQPILPCYSP